MRAVEGLVSSEYKKFSHRVTQLVTLQDQHTGRCASENASLNCQCCIVDRLRKSNQLPGHERARESRQASSEAYCTTRKLRLASGKQALKD